MTHIGRKLTVKLRKETSAHSSAQAWEPDNVHIRSAIGPVSGSGQVRGGLEYQVLAINSSACTNTSSHYTYYTLSSCIFYFLVSNLFGRKYFIFLCNWELVLIWLLKSLGKHDVQLWHKIRFWKSTFKE